MSQIRNPKGAGRPVGTGKYKGEKTQMVRVPISQKESVKEFLETKGQSINYFDTAVQAGYPAPATHDHDPERINLYSLIVENPEETYALKATGESMINAGINPDDILVVDRKKEAKNGSIVIASINGEFTVKRLEYKNNQPYLMPENPEFNPIPINEHDDVNIFGIVTHSIHRVI